MASGQGHQPSGLPVPNPTKSFWHIEPSALLLGHRSTRELPSQADIVIIGSGITGSSIARHLMDGNDERGLNIVMLEAREACWGATGRNGGHCQPLFLKHMHDPSVGRFERRNYLTLAEMIERENIDCEFVRQPSVRGLYDEDKLKQAQEKMAVFQKTSPELAHMARIMTSKEDLNKYRCPTAKGAIYVEQAARLWPYKLVAHVLEDLLRRPQAKGSFNLQTLTPVDKIEQNQSGWNVCTSRGVIKAGAVFLATNGYTSHLLPAWKDLIIPCRGQMSAQLPSESLAGKHRLTTSMGTEGVGMDEYLMQRSSKEEQLMYGGGRHLAPSLGIWDDSVISQDVAKHLRTALPERMQLYDSQPELTATHEWTGIMAWSRDGLPWVGPVPGNKNLYISAGYTGHGMPNAWLCGKAAVITYFMRGHELDTAFAYAKDATGLPTSYMATAERQGKALSGTIYQT